MTQELIQKSLEANAVSQVQWHGYLGLGQQFSSFLTLSHPEKILNGLLNPCGVPFLMESLVTFYTLPR